MYTCYAMFLNHLYVLNLLQSMNLFKQYGIGRETIPFIFIA